MDPVTLAVAKNYMNEKAKHEGEGTDSVAIGPGASAEGASSAAYGHNASAVDTGATALGRGASAVGTGATALGRGASAVELGAVALGYPASADGRRSIAIGPLSSAENENEGALGPVGTHWIVPGSFTVEGTKNFEIPHPHPDKRDTHRLRHAAVEAPTAGDTLYRYAVTATQDNDTVVMQLPDYFPHLNTDVQVWATGAGHFGRAYGVVLDDELHVTCETEGVYNVLVIGTRNDDHPSVQDWHIRGIEREVGESWRGETYQFSVDEIIEVDELMEVA